MVPLRWGINLLLKIKIRQTKNEKTSHSPFIDDIWGADLTDMRFNQRIRFLLCVIDILRKDSWVIFLKDKKGITITNVCRKNLNESNHKPSKIWIDKGGKFYNRSIDYGYEKMQ